MMIIGCDFHPSWQQVAVLDPQTGEVSERKPVIGDGEAERFYRGLPVPSLVGVEACGNSQWFIELLQRLGHEVWVEEHPQSYARRCAGWNHLNPSRRALHRLLTPASNSSGAIRILALGSMLGFAGLSDG